MESPPVSKLIGTDQRTGLAFGVIGAGLALGIIGVASSVLDHDPSRLAVAVGAVPIAGAGVFLLRRRVQAVRAALSGLRAQATVTAVMAAGSRARVRYRFHADGRPFEGVHVAWALTRVPAVGDALEVAYDPSDPRRSVLLAAFE